MSEYNGLPSLRRKLQTALEIELAVIPSYLVALLSIKLPGNREAAERIRSVMTEEMLHLTLVANVLNAIGGHPQLNRRAIPIYPLRLSFEGKSFSDRAFDISLERFSPACMNTFMQIELPRALEADEHLLQARVDVPELTIGGFYSDIITSLEEADRQTAGAIFDHDRARQIGEDYFWAGSGHPIAVSDLRTAKAALQLVIAQGEAAWPHESSAAHLEDSGRIGHYYRFKEIACGRQYLSVDDPTGDPTGPALNVDYDAVYPLKKDPKTCQYAPGSALAHLNIEFNRRYTMMLVQLEQALNGAPKALYTAIADAMRTLSPIAHEMMSQEIVDDPEGCTGCPTFEWVPV